MFVKEIKFMKKKLLLGLAALVAIAGGVAALSAFEAHIINVTAHIENALSASPEEILFGTVFPQEKLNRDLTISLSNSFQNQDRVDLVNYKIVQKPKPIKPEDSEFCRSWIKEFDLFSNREFLAKCYPPLCFYLSKEPDNNPPNDTGLPSYHKLTDIAYGALIKNTDPSDEWTIDLDVPCFKGECAQDWRHLGWEPPAELNGATFGCDLWVEATEISETAGPIIIEETGHLVINEVYYNVDTARGTEGDNEWLEIYNPTSNNVDISGWKISDNAATDVIPPGSIVPANGFAVITAQTSTWSFWSLPAPAVKIVLGNNIGSGLSNAGDRLLLKDSSDAAVDALSYGSDATILNPSIPNAPEGHSVSRWPSGIDTDSAADWIDLISPTPGS